MPNWQDLALDTHYYTSPEDLLSAPISGEFQDGTPASMATREGGGLARLGTQKITGNGTVKSPTPPAGAILAVVQAQNQTWRFVDGDGETPTTTFGEQFFVGSREVYNAEGIANMKFIEETTGTGPTLAALNFRFYGNPA